MLLAASLPRSALLAAAAGLVGALVLLRAATRPPRGKSGQRMPPVVEGWSIAHCVAFLRDQQGFLARCRAKYGDVFTLRIGAVLGGVDSTFVFREDDLRKYFREPESKLSLVRGALVVGKLFLAADPTRYEDERLAEVAHQYVSSSPQIAQAVKPDKLRAFIQQIGTFVSESVDRLPDKGEVDLMSLCRNAVLELTAKLMMGTEAAQDEAFMRTWVDLFAEADPDALVTSGGPGTFAKVFVETAVFGEREVFRRIRRHVGPTISKLIEDVIAHDGPVPGRLDMSHSLTVAWYNKLDHAAADLRAIQNRLINELFFFTIAAVGNTYAGAAWLLYHTLANTAGLGDRVVPELASVLGSGTSLANITIEDFDRLVNLQAGIDEITRLYTPGSFMRWVQEDWTTSEGYTIPAGTMAAVSACIAMRDPKSFPRPCSLDWGRTARGELKAGSLFLSWGSGAHPCLGRKLAYMELGVLAAALLSKLDMRIAMPESAFAFDAHFAGVERHPRVVQGQMAFLWRPAVPLTVMYSKRRDVSSHSG